MLYTDSTIISLRYRNLYKLFLLFSSTLILSTHFLSGSMMMMMLVDISEVSRLISSIFVFLTFIGYLTSSLFLALLIHVLMSMILGLFINRPFVGRAGLFIFSSLYSIHVAYLLVLPIPLFSFELLLLIFHIPQPARTEDLVNYSKSICWLKDWSFV